jgi:hypothetical protein
MEDTNRVEEYWGHQACKYSPNSDGHPAKIFQEEYAGVSISRFDLLFSCYECLE